MSTPSHPAVDRIVAALAEYDLHPDVVWLDDAVTTAQRAAEVIGGVAPLGHPAPVRTVVDTELDRYDEVWAAAGHARTVFPTNFAQLLRISGGVASPVEP